MKRNQNLPISLFLALVLCGVCGAGAQPRLTTKETLITTLEPEPARAMTTQYDYLPWGYHVDWSPDMKKVAHWVTTSKGMYLVVNGVAGKLIDTIEDGSPRGGLVPPNIIFSPDSRHFAYVARRGKKVFVVRDGQEGRPYNWIADNDLHFSADSKRMAYWAQRGPHNFMVLHDGKTSKEIAFDPKKRTPKKAVSPIPAFKNLPKWRVLDRDDKFVVLFNGKESAPYDGVYNERPTYSPDGKHAAWRARRNEQVVIVVDGIEADKTYQVPDGTRVPPVVFKDSNSLYTLGLRGNEVWRLEIEILPSTG
jgi:hypothetical protein